MKQTSLKNNEPSTIQEYIEAHIKEIQDFEQRPIDWTIRGKNAVEEAKQYTWFADAVSRIKPQLTRSDVREYYEKGELYVGFVATLLWGYAHTNYINNFRRIVATPKEEVEKKLNNMIAELSANPTEIEVCFKNMCNGGKNHVPGLGVSFFTKVFYFTCRIHGKGTWILDSKMWDAYNAFLKANGKDVKKYKVSNCRYKDYMQYCDYMRRNPYVKSPEKLEAFLFTHNNEIKTFLGLGNTHTKKEQSVKNPKPTKRNKKDNVSDYWSPFATFSSINHAYHNGLTISVPGYCIPLNGEQYRIFVAKWERKSSQKILVDYICKLMYEWGTDHNIDIDDNPDAVQIFNAHTITVLH